MIIRDIYDKFLTPPNLQKHMFRVAAVVKIITDNWIGELPEKAEIVEAALVHDIAKPVTFDVERQKLYIQDQAELERTVKNLTELKAKYGTDEPRALRAICSEAGMSPTAATIAYADEWEDMPNLLRIGNLPALVLIYADLRVGPKGLLTLDQRIDDIKARDQAEVDREAHRQYAKEVEKLIQSLIRVDLANIDEESVERVAQELSY